MNEKKEIRLVYSKDFETFFSDLVRIDANPETVSLTFGIRSSDNISVTASHRVIMTLPHFLRFADICNTTAKGLMDHIEQAKKKQK